MWLPGQTSQRIQCHYKSKLDERIAAKGNYHEKNAGDSTRESKSAIKNVPAQMLRAKTKSRWAQQKVIRIPGPNQRE